MTDTTNTERETIDGAYRVLTDGGLVLMPTDVGYGLVAMSDDAIRRIYELKQRPASKPCVTVVDLEIAREVSVARDPRVWSWLEQVSRDRPIAVVQQVRASSRLLAAASPYLREQATQSGTIATFFNAGTLVTALARRALADGRIVVGSSANASSHGNNFSLDEVPAPMRAGADLVIDRGPARYRNPERLATTMLDLIAGRFQRRGIEVAAIEESWRAFGREVLDATDEHVVAR
ncbi:Sua5/YciO/YrdC/YwlC family protein [Sandaracinus amylolyticus]|uniref:Sua5/YciO/YrdC/YwlC family protein n=1 Tax=Sandaracinus amylolyticus TaxID=927083 RepID=UPI001F418E4E|nr:Sua5/YciO/YrdC/YwlC family protein [Sandaracinus amylolyticus]UJR78517.1 Hypothetical protein I5071_5470 [Sandaracinus amylolyticus]